mmetsp:Transcript_29438/g.62671  ORF Transcript_29438/g.62671 Transcript_29438/m.62671 type:complete len:323 (-) Transcript_29438:110-1078(-)
MAVMADARVAAAALLAVLAAAGLRRCRRRHLQLQRRGLVVAVARDQGELLQEVRRRSKGVLYMVTDKTNEKFSIPNLTKYLQMKNVAVHEGVTPEETVAVNAERLLELLDRAGAVKPPTGPTPLRHAFMAGVVCPEKLQGLFPEMKAAYTQQPLDYGRNSRYGDKWRISCYLVVMENWKPRIEAHEPMVRCMSSVMNECTQAFSSWYCRLKGFASVDTSVMNAFVTRYRPIHEEDQLKKHIDGANVDGSVILALPTDDPFEGGKLHVWDGKPQKELEYKMQPGDVIFLDNAVFHQAKPITSGTRWALVLFLRVKNSGSVGGG